MDVVSQDGFRRRLANILQSRPFLLSIPYSAYKIFQPRFSVGVVAVVPNEAGHILLAEHVFHRLSWGLPGGWVKRNENPADGVQRELMEELELRVEISALLLAESTGRGHLDIAYLCTPLSAIGRLSRELLGYRWFDPADLPRLPRFHYQSIRHAQQLLKQDQNHGNTRST